jgi:hypothetical protein
MAAVVGRSLDFSAFFRPGADWLEVSLDEKKGRLAAAPAGFSGVKLIAQA